MTVRMLYLYRERKLYKQLNDCEDYHVEISCYTISFQTGISPTLQLSNIIILMPAAELMQLI